MNPRTYIALNLLEDQLEKNHFSDAVRLFREKWRPLVTGIVAANEPDFKQQFLQAIDGRRIYGWAWGPGLMPRRVTDALCRVRQAVEHTNLKEAFE